MVSLAIWDHSCHPTQANTPCFNPSQWRLVLDLSTPEGWKAELTCVAGYIPRWFTHPHLVTHPSTNWARRRVTSFIETNNATAKPRHHHMMMIYGIDRGVSTGFPASLKVLELYFMTNSERTLCPWYRTGAWNRRGVSEWVWYDRRRDLTGVQRDCDDESRVLPSGRHWSVPGASRPAHRTGGELTHHTDRRRSTQQGVSI